MSFKAVAQGGARLGLKGFGLIARVSFLFILFLIIIINSVIISIEAGSIEPGLKDLGQRFMAPTQKLGEESRDIISRQGIYDEDEPFLKSIWQFILKISSLTSSIVIILLWLKALVFVFLIVGMDTSKRPFAYLLAILFFILVQVPLSMMQGGSWMTPISAFIDFIRAIQYIVKPIVKIGDKLNANDLAKVAINDSVS